MKITVITVAFNSEKTIVDTLDSVGMQTHTEIEHLIIDGSSKDGTLEIVRGHSNPHIRLISEPDDGIYDAMNKGLSHAKGEIVGFLNSDDFFADATVLEKIANVFQDSEVDACYADLVYVSINNSRVLRYWKSKPFKKGDFAKGWCPAHPTFYVRKSLVESLGYFDKSYMLAADMEFMMRYLESGQVRSTYIPYVFVRMRIGGVSNRSWKNIVLQNKEIFSALRNNCVPFSRLWFSLNKVLNRLGQLVDGRIG